MSWDVFHAIATGTSHLEKSLPCQDACEIWTKDDRFVAAIADGAGSGSRSELASSICTRRVVEAMSEYLQTADVQPRDSRELMAGSIARLIVTIEDVRSEIDSLAEAYSLARSDLACTLVGAVALSVDEGYFFHVGDGAAVTQFEDPAVKPLVSPPENGEYSNETWFITADEWRDHLRITAFAHRVGLIAIMSDGPMPFVMVRDRSKLFSGFIDPVEHYLRRSNIPDGNAGLRSILVSDRVNAITNDDKSLVIALPRR